MKKLLPVLLSVLLAIGFNGCKDEDFTSEASYTASCPLDYNGLPVTVKKTATSNVDANDAYIKALAEAKDEAEELLVCEQKTVNSGSPIGGTTGGSTTSGSTTSGTTSGTTNGGTTSGTTSGGTTSGSTGGGTTSSSTTSGSTTAGTTTSGSTTSGTTTSGTTSGSTTSGVTTGGTSGCTARQCTGTTKAGNRCKNKTTNCSGRCYLH